MPAGTKSPSPRTEATQPPDSAAGCLLRTIWLVAGNVALVFVAVYLVKQRQGLGLTWVDGLYWGVAGLPIAARYLDIRYFNGATSEGEPATMQHWRRFSALLFGAALLLWLGAHAVAQVTSK